jgi:hypothetical protein
MEEFEASVIKLFNETPLPFEAKRYVMKHVATLIDVEYRNQIEKLNSKNAEEECDNGEMSC